MTESTANGAQSLSPASGEATAQTRDPRALRARANALQQIDRAYRVANSGKALDEAVEDLGGVRGAAFSTVTVGLLFAVNGHLMPVNGLLIVVCAIAAYVAGWLSARRFDPKQRLYELLERFNPEDRDLYIQLQDAAREGSWIEFSKVFHMWMQSETDLVNNWAPKPKMSSGQRAKEAFIAKTVEVPAAGRPPKGKVSVAALARRFGTTPDAVRARLMYLGCFVSEPGGDALSTVGHLAGGEWFKGSEEEPGCWVWPEEIDLDRPAWTALNESIPWQLTHRR